MIFKFIIFISLFFTVKNIVIKIYTKIILKKLNSY